MPASISAAISSTVTYFVAATTVTAEPTSTSAFIGGFDRAFLNGIYDPASGVFSMAATFSKETMIPEFIFVAFQGTLPRKALSKRLREIYTALYAPDASGEQVCAGSGLLDEPVVYETVFYEGFTPHQVPVIVECLTENRNRTSANIKQAFRKGRMASAGAVSWDFARVGAIEATHASGAMPRWRSWLV